MKADQLILVVSRDCGKTWKRHTDWGIPHCGYAKRESWPYESEHILSTVSDLNNALTEFVPDSYFHAFGRPRV